MKTVRIWLLLFVMLGIVLGCKSKAKSNPVEEEQKKVLKNKGRLVRDLAKHVNLHYAKVQGVALVKGLPETGANEPPSFYQQLVLKELQRDFDKKDKARDEIASLSTAIVLLEANVPPGAQKGDHIDIDVMLPPGSEATSIQGGFIEKANLHQFLTADTLRSGDRLGIANGYVLVGQECDSLGRVIKKNSTSEIFSDKKGQPKGEGVDLRQGKIPGGVIITKSRPVWLEIREGEQTAGVAQRLEDVINNRFSFVKNGSKRKVAEAKYGAIRINLVIPDEYRDNVNRYMNVVCGISFFETPDELSARINSLKVQLNDPEQSEAASIQLEAIGPNNPAVVEVIAAALSHPNETVRFHSAISIAYMNVAKERNRAANILAEFARTNHQLRPAALAVLGTTLKASFEAEARLREMLSESDEETRYGAFRALWTRNPKDYMILGENMNGYFDYHSLNCGGLPLVHIAESKRPEIVLFSKDNIFLQGNFNLDAGARITVRSQGSEVIIKRYKSGIDEQRIVNYRLDEIIRGVVDVGGTYPDVVEMLLAAQRSHHLVAYYGQNVGKCELAIDALPGREDKFRLLRDAEELALADVHSTKESKSERSFWKPNTWFASNSKEKEKGETAQEFSDEEFQ